MDFLYSVKCNNFVPLVKSVFDQGFGADAASLGEVLLANGLGLTAEKIFYSAPGKSRSDISGAWDKANLIADSLNEIEMIEGIAAAKNETINIGVRINPDFAFDGSEALPSKFGIDEDQFIAYEKTGIERHPHVKIIGLHVHLKSQELSSEAISNYYCNVFSLVRKVELNTDMKIEYVNLGSGIGIPYAENDSEIDLSALSENLKKLYEGCSFRLLIETGRYVVGKCGYYVTKVMDRKVSHGKTFIILKNTMNAFLRPSLARLVEQYAGGGRIPGCEPLYTGRNSFSFETLNDSETETEKVDLVGNLCTAADMIARDVIMPKLDEGNLVVINNAGAYAAVLSPMQFSSQEKPQEFLMKADGSLCGTNCF